MGKRFRQLQYLLRKSRQDAELREEIETHRSLRQAALEREGLSASDAAHASSRALGNTTLTREDVRGWTALWLESLWQDARYAVRGLRKSPGFMLPTLVALVIGMGLTTSLFAAVDALYFRPWPVPQADRVVVVHAVRPIVDGTVYATGPAEYRYLRERASAVDLFAFDTDQLRTGSEPKLERLAVRLVSGNYFRALRTPLVGGRGLTDADDDVGRPTAIVVISNALWLREFNRNVSAIGSTLQIENVPFTIVGIAGIRATDSPRETIPDAWIALSSVSLIRKPADARRFLSDPDGCCVEIAGRLADGTTVASADAELRLLAAQFATAHSHAVTTVKVTNTTFINNWQATRALGTFALLGAAVCLTLVLGCANVGNLQLARGLSRRRDMAIRRSLGATRSRLVRQLLVEGLVLSTVAASIALAIASVLPRLLLARDLRLDERALNLSPGLSSVGFACVLTLVTCLCAGLLPALRVTRAPNAAGPLSPRRSRLRSSLLAIQVGISAVLLVGACLLARGVYRAAGSNLDFNPSRVVVVEVLPPPTASTAADARDFSKRLLQAVDEAGIGPIGATAFVPFGSYDASHNLRVPGEGPPRTYRAVTHRISPGYFEVLGIPIVAGRLLEQTGLPGDVVANESLAQLLWPRQSALGRTFLDDGEKRIVGIVADAHTELYERVSPTYYQPVESFSRILVRDDRRVVAQLQQVISRLAPNASSTVTPLVSGLQKQLDGPITGASIAGTIALLALLLAAVGTFGVFSYVIEERTQEIGVRIALGARAADIARELAASVSRPLVLGLGAGVLAAQGAGSILRAQLFGVSPRDPIAYVAALSVMAAAAFVAMAAPARRAVRVDPAVTLRHD